MASFSINTGKQLSIGTGVGEIVALATAVAAAQQFGSALYTRYTHQPLRELIQALNGDTDIAPPRYHGRGIYDEENGKIMTLHGEIKAIAMNKVIANEGERPTQLSTLIVCLSVTMSKELIGAILASAVMLFVHGVTERAMEGTIRMLRGKIEKYAIAVLSRDSMCGRLECKRNEMRRLVQRSAPEISVDALFLPPLTPQEEGDFAEFLVELWTARADGVKIFTRSVKLLGFALLLSEYGWQIDVFVENEAGKIDPLKMDTRALSVIYSILSTHRPDRTYVENHRRYLNLSRMEFYPTAICTAAHMGEVSGLSLAKTSADRDNFSKGYRIAQNFCTKYWELNVSLRPEGKILMTAQSRAREPQVFVHERSCQQLLNRFLPPSVPHSVRTLVTDALCEMFSTFDWGHLDDEVDKQRNPHASFTTLLLRYVGNCDMLWVVSGAVLGISDKIIGSLINLSAECTVRTPAGEGISKFVSGSANFLNDLFTTGLGSGQAVQFCAMRLAGVIPENLKTESNTSDSNIIGYYNAQQGILVTPVFERSLYCDLPEEKLRPLTLFNFPIEGMPSDERGWIRPGTVQSPLMKQFQKVAIEEPGRCNVIMEYRPHFESDSNSVVAAVYIDGVFSNLLSLSNTLSSFWHVTSQCDHPDIPGETEIKHINLQGLKSGEIELPDDDDVLMVSPQQNQVSRLFSASIFQSSKPVIQNGCLDCAVRLALEMKGGIIIPRIPKTSLA